MGEKKTVLGHVLTLYFRRMVPKSQETDTVTVEKRRGKGMLDYDVLAVLSGRVKTECVLGCEQTGFEFVKLSNASERS